MMKINSDGRELMDKPLSDLSSSPWVSGMSGKFDQIDMENGFIMVASAMDMEICKVTYSPAIHDQAMANLKLIKAAPELLEALIDVRDNVISDGPDMWARVNAAISKATGGE